MIDFSALSKLVRLDAAYRGTMAGLEGLSKLRSLTLWDYSELDAERLTPLVTLEELSLKSTGKLRHLSGIGSLRGLRRIEVTHCPAQLDLAPLAYLSNLLSIELDSCRRLATLGGLAGLASLEELTLHNCGKIESLHPLRACPQMRRIYLSGDTVVEDGDISVVRSLPMLEEVRFDDRRTYNARQKDFDGN